MIQAPIRVEKGRGNAHRRENPGPHAAAVCILAEKKRGRSSKQGPAPRRYPHVATDVGDAFYEALPRLEKAGAPDIGTPAPVDYSCKKHQKRLIPYIGGK